MAADPTQVDELVEWFEDVTSGAVGAAVVSLTAPCAARRTAVLAELRSRLERHPSVHRAWSARRAADGFVGDPGRDLLAGPLPFAWLECVATEEALAEPAQLVEQLEALRPHESVLGPLARTFAHAGALLDPAVVESPGDAAGLAFAFLAPIEAIDRFHLSGALRALDDSTGPAPLLRDAGVLGLDGASLATRGLVVAGWLEHLARHVPVVLVVHEAEQCGPFLRRLVSTAATADAPILVVLATETVDGAPLPTAVPITATAELAVPPIAVPSEAARRVARNLAAALPTALFTRRQWTVAASACGCERNDLALLDELVAAGAARRLTPDVWAFVAPTAGETATNDPDDADDADDAMVVLDGVVEIDATPLGQIVEHEGAGDLATGARWRALWGHPSSSSAPERDADDVRADLVRAAGLGAAATDAASALVRSALDRLAPPAPGTEVEPAAEQRALARRVAAARIALAHGDLDAADRALGADLRGWLAIEAVDQLDTLSPWRAYGGIVARSLDVLRNLHLIAVLRRTAPGTPALAAALLARLELLERIGRLHSAVDALGLADEARTIVTARRGGTDAERWTAERWWAWSRLRAGRPDEALAVLRRVVHEQAAAGHRPTDEGGPTRLWLGEALAIAGRDDEAVAELTNVVTALGGPARDDVSVWAARRWRALSRHRLGQYDAALAEVTAVLAHDTTALDPDSAEVLLSRHVHGAVLANLGRLDEAFAELDAVVARLSLVDLPDAPALLAARQARAVCLLFGGRADDALAELDEVIKLRLAWEQPDAVALTDARNDRAVALLVLEQWGAALDGLDEVLRARTASGDDRPRVAVYTHQQRAVALHHLGRLEEAFAELDQLVAASEGWTADEALAQHVRQHHAVLAGELGR